MGYEDIFFVEGWEIFINVPDYELVEGVTMSRKQDFSFLIKSYITYLRTSFLLEKFFVFINIENS